MEEQNRAEVMQERCWKIIQEDGFRYKKRTYTGGMKSSGKSYIWHPGTFEKDWTGEFMEKAYLETGYDQEMEISHGGYMLHADAKGILKNTGRAVGIFPEMRPAVMIKEDCMTSYRRKILIRPFLLRLRW